MESLEGSRFELYGLATVGLIGGIAREGWQSAKDLLARQRESATPIGQTALTLVEAPPTDDNVVIIEFGERPNIAA